MFKRILHFPKSFLELVLPQECFLCHNRAGDYFCPVCREFERAADIYLGNKAKTLYNDNGRIWVPFVYKGRLRQAIHIFKYKGNYFLSRFFASEIKRHLLEHNADFAVYDYIVPVPMPRYKFRERGYNPAGEIARRLSKATGIPYRQILLCREDKTSQVGKNRRERLKGPKGKFLSKYDSLKGLKLILVDDVITTGATISECARVLKEKGALKVDTVAVAKGEGIL